MDKLTKNELEEYWQLSFDEGDAETCIAIDREYLNRFGQIAFRFWVIKRIKG